MENIPQIISQEQKIKIKIWSWIYSSCVSSLHALIVAIFNCQQNSETTHLILGVDAINQLEVSGFAKIGGNTKERCRPFSKKRDGILISEGACAITISKEKGASEIGINGVGMYCDAGDATSPDKNGLGLENAIKQALDSATLSENDIGCIILHGTGTKINDQIEAKVILRMFNSEKIIVSSIKGLLGHTMGAAGLFNILVAVSALKDGVLPPTLDEICDNEFGLNLSSWDNKKVDTQKAVLVLASGFGGNNVAVILSKAN